MAETPEGAGQEVGARQPGAGRCGRGVWILGGLGDSGPLGSRRATGVSAETMAKEEGEGCAPTAAADSGEGAGPGCGLRAAGSRAGAPEFAERPGPAEKMAQSFLSRNSTQKWSLKSGVSERKLLLGGGAAGPELLRPGKQDEVYWVLVLAGSFGCRLGGIAPLGGN